MFFFAGGASLNDVTALNKYKESKNNRFELVVGGTNFYTSYNFINELIGKEEPVEESKVEEVVDRVSME